MRGGGGLCSQVASLALLALAPALTAASSLPQPAPSRSSHSHFWQRIWQRNPADFESHASRALQQAMDRLVLGQRRRGWGRGQQPRPTGWRQRGDALRLVLQVWRQRDDPALLLSMCDELAAIVHDERAVDELEAYLPQLAHIILTLPADSLLSSLLERFALRLCESNVHWALQARRLGTRLGSSSHAAAALTAHTLVLLQLRWIAYASLHENRPELGDAAASAEAHARAARLLELVEQSVVYGVKSPA